MQDNSTTEMLIRYMDGELDEQQKEATEKMLQGDAALQEQYQYLLAAKKAIRTQGLKQRVAAIHGEYMQEAKGEEKVPASVVKSTPFFTTFMRIAAIFIVAVLGYGAYQYATTTNQVVYDENYISYQLPVNRGSDNGDNVDALYNAGNYNGVINAFNAKGSKNQKDYFVAAQAYLQLNNANAAIDAFKQVQDLNSKSSEKYFEQETDYYLTLAYIKAGKIDDAEKLLNKIESNKQHLFYNKAKDISHTKLMMLKWKE